MKQVIILLCVLSGFTVLHAQDSLRLSQQRKNTIKLDITSHYLYRNALIVAYERITKPNQSFVVTAGYQEFPRSSSLGDGIVVKDDRKRNGYKFGGEYRFYLKKENKYLAPRGVYIGPYFTFLGFNNERTITFDNDGTSAQADLDAKFSIVNIGFQLGYQFVIKNRWTIDLVFAGPSISHYRYNLDLTSSANIDKEDIKNEVILDLIDRFPLLEDLIDDKEVSGRGKLDTWSFGYRYQLQVGYHFGRKKK
ncbi:MAG TPA: DUF3575 domain-containing protein [Chryseolinea sp.]|nr:DUF3575 domain-containing protein [Chryseolinea sp.]